MTGMPPLARAATSNEGAFERTWRQGREMPLNEAIALAFSLADGSDRRA